jgi:hypothetical protein
MKTDASEYALAGTEACDPNMFYLKIVYTTMDASSRTERTPKFQRRRLSDVGLVPQGNCGSCGQDSGMSPESRFKTVTEWHRRVIDDDSKMRFGATQTNPRHRQQLQTRCITDIHITKRVSRSRYRE